MARTKLVNAEQAAAVFRRAAELEAAGVSGGVDGVLDERALTDIGEEVGLSPASIRAAMAELDGPVLSPEATGTWGTVTASRSVAGSRAEIVTALGDKARRNMLAEVHRSGDTTVWARSHGPSAAVARALRGRRLYPLLAFQELRATIVEAESRPDVSRVRLEGSLLFPLRLLSNRGRLLPVVGIGGGLLLALAVPVSPGDHWVLEAAGLLSATAGTGVGLRSYRRTVTAAEAALEGLLDRIGGPVTPPSATLRRPI